MQTMSFFGVFFSISLVFLSVWYELYFSRSVIRSERVVHTMDAVY